MLVSIDKRNAAYWHVTLNNPPFNLMDPDLFVELRAFLDAAEKDDDLKVVVFDSGVPDFFMAHLDTRSASDEKDGVSILGAWDDFVARLVAAPFTTIAAIRGRARGIGNEFFCACDMRFASETAIIAQNEVGASVVPGGGGMDWLPRLVGRSRALEIVLSANDFDARTAELYGWVNRTLPDAELDGFVEALAMRISMWDRDALREAKRFIDKRAVPADQREIKESLDAIGKLWQGPAALKRIDAMGECGNNVDRDFELEQPAEMARLAREAHGAQEAANA